MFQWVGFESLAAKSLEYQELSWGLWWWCWDGTDCTDCCRGRTAASVQHRKQQIKTPPQLCPASALQRLQQQPALGAEVGNQPVR